MNSIIRIRNWNVPLNHQLFSYFLHFVLESHCSFPRWLHAPDPGQCCMRDGLCWSGLSQLEPGTGPISAASLSPTRSCIADTQCVDTPHFREMYYYLIRVPEKILILCVLLYAMMLCGGLYLTLNWFLSDHIKSIK